MLFGGVVKDGPYLHALCLFKDHSSGVVRLEASASRGPMENVPPWRAFVTKYAHDDAWALLEPGSSVVSLAVLKPPPYIFLSGYYPPRRRHNYGDQYLLDFDQARGKPINSEC